MGALALVPPRSTLIFDTLDRLGAVTYTARGLFVDRLGVVRIYQKQFPGGTANIVATTVDAYPDGELVTLDVAASGVSLTRGDCFVRVWVGQGVPPSAVRVGLIGAAYVTLQGCPGNLLQYSEPAIDAEVSPMFLALASPGAGTDLLFAIANAAFWELTAVSFRLVTSVAVATRQVTLLLADGVVPLIETPASATQVGSSTRDYVFAAYGYQPTSLVGTILTASPLLRFGKGMSLQTATTGLDVGDVISNVRLTGLRCVDF